MPAYSELLPAQLQALWHDGAPAIVPWGALEWHGAHLPLGLDGLVADWFAMRLAEETSGVLLPGMWLPMTTLPHQFSVQFRTETVRMVFDDLLSGLYASGARKICLVTGHYAQGHQIEMTEAAIRAMEDHDGLMVFAASPLELLSNNSMLDHAAHYETSQLMRIRPDLVHLEKLSSDVQPISESAVLGEAPKLGSAVEGESLLSAGIERWKSWISLSTAEGLSAHYKGVFDRYAPYVDTYYRGSWEDAIKAWWADKVAQVA